MASRFGVIGRGVFLRDVRQDARSVGKTYSPQGGMAMKWFILAGIWVFFFLVWHAHTIFGEDD